MRKQIPINLQPKAYYEETRFFDGVSSFTRPGAINGYSILYGLTRSGIKEKPFRETFFVSMLSKERVRNGIRTTVAEIVPPEGYEHLSLDPRVIDKEFLEAQEKKREENDKSSKSQLEKTHLEPVTGRLTEKYQVLQISNKFLDLHPTNYDNLIQIAWCSSVLLGRFMGLPSCLETGSAIRYLLSLLPLTAGCVQQSLHLLR